MAFLLDCFKLLDYQNGICILTHPLTFILVKNQKTSVPIIWRKERTEILNDIGRLTIITSYFERGEVYNN